MLGIPLILSFFATRYEWDLPLGRALLGCHKLSHAVGGGLALSAFAVICIPFLERLVFWFVGDAARRRLFLLVVEPLRFGCLALSLYLTLGSIAQIPWLSSVFGRGGPYLAVAVVFSGGSTAAIYWVRHIERVKGSVVVFVLIGFGVSFFYYLSVASYVFGVYPAIPANRGGRLPVTEAYLEQSGHDSLFQQHRKMDGVVLWGPVYIIEQTSDTIYFASKDMNTWFDRFVSIHALHTATTPYIRYNRIDDGFPRVPRTVPTR
jgi:hypothetical protein